ncbi:MAG TPA: nucleotide pyrophosphohydrolase [Casimicrobiaceae bacterium]|nr:nucleotide pyrophosphohydrolase [Casimicrobiaceae bacterium]
MAQRKAVQGLNVGRGPSDLIGLRDRLREFAEPRDWNQFHSPKNLAIALSVEAGEVLEQFQWTTDCDSLDVRDPKRQAIEEELADVLLCLVRLADKLNIDLLAAAQAKIVINSEKYPVETSRGSARKYTEL